MDAPTGAFPGGRPSLNLRDTARFEVLGTHRRVRELTAEVARLRFAGRS